MHQHSPGRFDCFKRILHKKMKLREVRNHLASVESGYVSKIRLVNSDKPGRNSYAGIPKKYLP